MLLTRSTLVTPVVGPEPCLLFAYGIHSITLSTMVRSSTGRVFLTDTIMFSILEYQKLLQFMEIHFGGDFLYCQ